MKLPGYYSSGDFTASGRAPENQHVGEQADVIYILELGGDGGSLWTENLDRLPENVHITVSDITEAMIRDIRRNIGPDNRFIYECFDC